MDTGLERTDITEGKPGLPVRMIFKVVHVSDCLPYDQKGEAAVKNNQDGGYDPAHELEWLLNPTAV